VQKYFEIDDIFEETKRQHSDKLSSLESIIRLFEVKTKNAQDQSKCKLWNVLPLYPVIICAVMFVCRMLIALSFVQSPLCYTTYCHLPQHPLIFVALVVRV